MKSKEDTKSTLINSNKIVLKFIDALNEGDFENSKRLFKR